MTEERTQSEGERSLPEKFHEFFPNGELIEISYEELPTAVREHFESQSEKYILPEDYKEKNFTSLYKIFHSEEHQTYIAEQTKTYIGTSGGTEELVYLAVVEGGVMTGYVEVRNNITDKGKFFAEKPFVGFTRTYDGYEGEGRGGNRLKEADAFSRARFGNPLWSSELREKEASRVWEKLVEEGEAERVEEGDKIRYRMK